MSEEIKPLKVFVGWDSREDIAYQVAKASIERRTKSPVEVIPLKQKSLRKDGLYWRDVDKLASTEFTFTRFLVPELMNYNGWALFIDCDFVFVDDIQKLFNQADARYAVMCAQHDYTPKEGTKMDGQKQTVYPRKNWSSMMLINCGHPSNRKLTRMLVNDAETTGAYLHRFSWLKDSEVGKLSHEWNWLVEWYSSPKDGKPRALHYTEGGPWFDQYEDCEYANEWYKMYKYYNEHIKIPDDQKQQDKLLDKFSNIENFDATLELKSLITDLVHYVIDPQKEFYNVTWKDIESKANNTMGKVAAINTSEVQFERKGQQYDPILESLALGSNGVISSWETQKDLKTPLIIRGVGGGSQTAYKHCWETNRTFYAIDTGYLGNDKKKIWHRVTKNNLQILGPIIERPDDRLRKINWSYKKSSRGSDILICPPSIKIMTLFNQPDPVTWTNQVIEELKKYTDRNIRVRLKPNRTERVTTNTIQSDLDNNVHCLITYNSIAATEAILHGKPAIAIGPNAAQIICNSKLSEVENLTTPSKDEVEAFARHLSYCQFTVNELKNGTAWRIVNEGS